MLFVILTFFPPSILIPAPPSDDGPAIIQFLIVMFSVKSEFEDDKERELADVLTLVFLITK